MAERNLQSIYAKQINIKGIVQGVGFRPFVYNLAQKYNLHGIVFNTSSGLYIKIEGNDKNINSFIYELKANPPKLSKIDEVLIESCDVEGYRDFSIKLSQKDDGFVPISPDMGVCDDCVNEMMDENNRRYRYPFINCTNCGPRFSIIEDIPYDRPKTSMKKFPMCDLCKGEYTNPLDRRFHAQPVACFDCGPSLNYVGPNANDDPIKAVAEDLRDGKIVAIKGIGGYHLAVNALSRDAVFRLRERKNRYGKPLALMMKDIDCVKKFCYLSDDEMELLNSQRRPIVLLKKKHKFEGISDGLDSVGVMLPYTPIHYLLFEFIDFPIVMTSGNISEEPLCKDNEEALKRLKGIADSFLLNNRDIVNRIDDTVTSYKAKRERVIRRARGYAPQPILFKDNLKSILAVGGYYKNTFCLTKGNYAFLSHHIGDLDNSKTYMYYMNEIKKYIKLFKAEPKYVACDMHPGYLSTQFAKSLDLPVIYTQHHHAHIVSCMAEYGISDKVIGFAYDGTGYGPDGNVWGAEFLIADLKDFVRAGHLKYNFLPGGELAIKKIYRTSIGFIKDDMSFYGDYLKRFDPKEIEIINMQMDRKMNAPLVSSIGRFFDAVTSLIGLEDVVKYEGQAAMELESIIESDLSHYDYSISNVDGYIVDTSNILRQVYSDYLKGISKGIISARFHNTIVEFTVDIALRLRENYKINKVVLSGGSFQNKYLLENITDKLLKEGFSVYSNSMVPCNDGGIALGQAVIANYKLEV
ncbi:carbamoyltransferase HypF [Thermoanaerobacterium thermosaccharolyticum]|uniref:carbamoyltransferase HypF n=1 Tax=Thermoanaerobacterium thermosaccharolyticum TaxID=1517 RepID=UPI003D2A4CA5